MQITTKWNSLFDWRYADISDTGLLADACKPSTYILSAPAWGLKGKVPGARHAWVSTFDGLRWKTHEVSDLETIDIQGANVFYAKYTDKTLKQIIVSDRLPATKWFGNTPRIDHVADFIEIDPVEYPCNREIDLLFNNCNTFTSYIAWKYSLKYKPLYVGFKSKKFWDLKK